MSNVNDMLAPSRRFPRYRCHKEVNAAQITAIRSPEEPGDVSLIAVDVQFEVAMWLAFSTEWMSKHTPTVGGYIVLYDDGYVSFSPAEPFESGYTKLEA